ncbi:MAG: hypothetical protein J0H53_24345 [Rhizobiales bacterium]|nr:hypothetical protein [Hyphomicrobiales bacterium]
MTAALALGGACAACCALPLAAGLSMFAAAGGAAYVGGAAGIAVAAGAGALAWYMLRRRESTAPPAAGRHVSAGGCAPSSSKTNENTEEAIACTLQGDDFKSRATWIRGIAERHLRKSMRSPLTLYLVYGPEAVEDVREMVRKERECCAFLRFDLSVANDEVHLLITAPEAAREEADMLFDHFAPDLAAQPA